MKQGPIVTDEVFPGGVPCRCGKDVVDAVPASGVLAAREGEQMVSPYLFHGAAPNVLSNRCIGAKAGGFGDLEMAAGRAAVVPDGRGVLVVLRFDSDQMSAFVGDDLDHGVERRAVPESALVAPPG